MDRIRWRTVNKIRAINIVKKHLVLNTIMTRPLQRLLNGRNYWDVELDTVQSFLSIRTVEFSLFSWHMYRTCHEIYCLHRGQSPSINCKLLQYYQTETCYCPLSATVICPHRLSEPLYSLTFSTACKLGVEVPSRTYGYTNVISFFSRF